MATTEVVGYRLIRRVTVARPPRIPAAPKTSLMRVIYDAFEGHASARLLCN
ncbi:hypothetical protein [Infirmifilum sp. SLHALR2]